MVRMIKGPSTKGYFAKTPSGKSYELNRDGSIREYHDKWNDPIPPPPERKPEKKKDWEIPGIPYDHPPDYLVPLGGGFFMTPDTDKIKDPTNCDGNLADISPWCGGNPFTRDLIAVNPEVKFDECNIWVSFEPAIFFMKMAPTQIAYRFPGPCRDEPPAPIPTPPGHSGQTFNYPDDIPDDALVYAFVELNGAGGYSYTKLVNGKEIGCNQDGTIKVEFTNYNCPGMFHHHKVYYTQQDFYWYDSPINGTYNFHSTNEDPCYFGTDGGVTIDEQDTVLHWDTNSVWYSYLGIAADGTRVWYQNPSFTGYRYLIQPPYPPVVYNLERMWVSGGPEAGIYYGLWSVIKLYFTTLALGIPEDGYAAESYNVKYVVAADCSSAKDNSKKPPPPLGPDRPCCMACCNQPNNDDNAILKEILAQVKKANKAIGSDEFPATFPQGLTKAQRDSNVELESVAQLLKQQVIYLDGVTGEYDITIEVEDISSTQEGNQSQTFKLENQAEAIAEMFGMLINNSMNSELTVQLIVKTLIECGVLRQQLHNTQSHVKAMSDYFGYRADEKNESVPFTFTVPDSDNINEFKMQDFLKTSNQDIEVVKLSSKEVGKHRVYMMLLEKTAGIIKAVFWRNLGKDAAAVAGKVRDLLKKQDATIKQIDKHDAELEQVLEDFERGYTDFTPFVGDSSKPYGDEYAARPKTRIIKKPVVGEGGTTP